MNERDRDREALEVRHVDVATVGAEDGLVARDQRELLEGTDVGFAEHLRQRHLEGQIVELRGLIELAVERGDAVRRGAPRALLAAEGHEHADHAIGDTPGDAILRRGAGVHMIEAHDTEQ